MAKSTAVVVAVICIAILCASEAAALSGHNITAVLDAFPDYSIYNSYLTKTKVADEINSRETVTCLVLNNAAMSALAGKHSLAGIKNALRLLTLLDYFDQKKLHDLPRGTTLATTLLQTTGNAPGQLGFVNITNLRGGRVAFASAAPGAKPEADYTKAVKQIPYTLSVIEITAPVTFAGLFDAPDANNLTQVLIKAGCKTFASLIESSGVLKMYQDAMDKGLTILAPNDEAFKAAGVPSMDSLSSAETVTLLQYHALPSYSPKDTLKVVKGPIPTLASSGAGKYDISVTSRGDDVSIDTGVDNSRVASMILDSPPVCVLTIDNVLLPVELFGKGPAAAPGPAGMSPSLAPSPATEAPTPALASAPTPEIASPPAPPSETPEGSPSEAPGPSADDKTADDKAAASNLQSFTAVVVASFAGWFVIASSF